MSDGLFPEFSAEDERWMREVLRLAEKGRGQVSPNPMVGAVIVKSGEVVGKGHHSRYGGPHAEAIAIADAAQRADGATLYVNLEPCVHFGRTPPCVEKIVKARILRVVIACKDPDRLVNGKGIEQLLRSHIKVDVGLMEAQARKLNQAYFKHRETGMPWVILKVATTLDAKLASPTGNSQWITCEEARRFSHQLRAEADAVMVGVGTVLADDPQLTSRLVTGRNPIKVVLDSSLRTPPEAKLFDEGKTIVFTSRASLVQRDRYNPAKISFAAVDLDERGRLHLRQVLGELGRRQVAQLLVEGGGTIASEFLRQGLVDRFIACINPSLLGKAIGYTDTIEYDDVNQRLCLADVNVSWLGSDLKIEGTPCSPEEAGDFCAAPESKEE